MFCSLRNFTWLLHQREEIKTKPSFLGELFLKLCCYCVILRRPHKQSQPRLVWLKKSVGRKKKKKKKNSWRKCRYPEWESQPRQIFSGGVKTAVSPTNSRVELRPGAAALLRVAEDSRAKLVMTVYSAPLWLNTATIHPTPTHWAAQQKTWTHTHTHTADIQTHYTLSELCAVHCLRWCCVCREEEEPDVWCKLGDLLHINQVFLFLRFK